MEEIILNSIALDTDLLVLPCGNCFMETTKNVCQMPEKSMDANVMPQNKPHSSEPIISNIEIIIG